MAQPLSAGDAAHEERLMMGRFLLLCLRRSPTAAFLAEVRDWLADLPMEPINPEMAGGAELLAQYAELTRHGPVAEAAKLLQQDYQALFEGPGPMGAPPWESVYRSEDQVLFGPCTLEVRQAYRRWGLDVEAQGREPEDHIALELAFLLFLTERTAIDPAARAERTCFLEQHLRTWIRPFCALMEDQATTPFYQGIARLLLGYILAEADA